MKLLPILRQMFNAHPTHKLSGFAWKRYLCVLSLLSLMLLAACATGPVTSQPPQQGQSSTVPTTTSDITQYKGRNLIVNGDAEAGSGVTNVDDVIKNVPGWITSGTFTPMVYGTIPGGPGKDIDGPENRGKNFFTGGPADAPNAVASATQTIDLVSLAQVVDSGQIPYTLTAWLGGYGSFTNAADVNVQFLGTGGQQLGTAQVGPVLRTDRKYGDFSYKTGIYQRNTNGLIPAGTRQLKVVLTIKPYSQNPDDNGPYNDGYADNLSFMLG